MRKSFTKMMAALALLVFMAPSMVGWGQSRETVTLQYSGGTTTNMTGNNDAALVGLSVTDWSVVGDKGGNQNYPGLNKDGDIRLYYAANGSNTITVTNLGDNTISSIAITYTSDSYNNGKVLVNGSEVTASDGSYAINATSFVITNGNTSNVQVRIKKIEMSYSSGTPSTDPRVDIPESQLSLSCEANENGSFSVSCIGLIPNAIVPTLYSDAACENEFPTSGDDAWIVLTETTQSYIYYSVAANNGAAERTAYLKVVVTDYNNGAPISVEGVFAITQAAYVAPPTPGTWVLTDLADLTVNDVFVIVGTRTDETYGGNYAMPNDNGTSAAPAAVAVTVAEGTLSAEPAANLQWNLGITDDGYIFYPNGTTESWLYCTNTNNGVRVGTNDNKVFTVSEEGYLYNTATNRYIGIYNSQDWRCYTTINNSNITGQTFAFYKKVEETPATDTYTLDITGYGTGSGNWYFIASPIGEVSPEDVENMLSGDYDLYVFDQSAELEWHNYKNINFNLEPGKGYLYANKEDVTLKFRGEEYSDSNTFDLDYYELDGVSFTGWNLVGNPFGRSATIGQDFYRMNAEGSDFDVIVTTNKVVEPMEGVFVHALNTGEQATFFPVTEGNAQNGRSQLIVNVARNDRSGALIDRAIVRFNGDGTLPKFQLNANHTKIYIPQDGKDYAIVNAEAQGEMPFSFKAENNGTYTLNFATENIEMEYLHLIDNMTGADIDLLATPSYSFEARTTDYASRFRIVFSTNGTEQNMTEANTTFAFFNGTNWTVSNEGQATLQVLDMTGRVLSTETLNGNAAINMNQPAGVYMLRLVNGDNVKTQKIIIK